MFTQVDDDLPHVASVEQVGALDDEIEKRFDLDVGSVEAKQLEDPAVLMPHYVGEILSVLLNSQVELGNVPHLHLFLGDFELSFGQLHLKIVAAPSNNN